MSTSPPRSVRGGVPAQQRDLRPQGRKTVGQLLDAAVSVLAAMGYQAARVEDIVRAAKTSHGTFYLYFANKEDLLRSLAQECSEDMNRLADQLGPVGRGDDGLAELRAWILDFSNTYQRHAPVIRAWSEQQVQGPEMEELGLQAFDQITSRLVARLEVVARSASAAEPEKAAVALLALLERFSYFRISRRLYADTDEWLDTLAVMVHCGFFGGGRPPRR